MGWPEPRFCRDSESECSIAWLGRSLFLFIRYRSSLSTFFFYIYRKCLDFLWSSWSTKKYLHFFLSCPASCRLSVTSFYRLFLIPQHGFSSSLPPVWTSQVSFCWVISFIKWLLSFQSKSNLRFLLSLSSFRFICWPSFYSFTFTPQKKNLGSFIVGVCWSSIYLYSSSCPSLLLCNQFTKGSHLSLTMYFWICPFLILYWINVRCDQRYEIALGLA